ncbi:hypothetical protein PGTUg99_004875 [Puccinia graminis f. sp. tritici]|uniref:Tet-like 2OG-Fe(II) oxygenase domain-containing protein n=1 Tax=Puccinia graminis f. sp. tritici TaxID=56615 RepID=A0A5B0RZR3_PUCGR|nr:hypothetical protein PGTUg99_004875 [Puccinia graminis f. sp. tritici]
MVWLVYLKRSCVNKDLGSPKPLQITSPPPRIKSTSSRLNAHQRQKRNAYLAGRRQNKRETACAETVTNKPAPSGIHVIKRRVKPIDLFPNITAELLERVATHKERLAAHKADPKHVRKPRTQRIIARKPTHAENAAALHYVQKNFKKIDYGYTKIYDESTDQIIAMVHYLPIDSMPAEQFDDINFLTLFLHQCKEFIHPVHSKTRKCGGIMWAIGWRKAYDGLEILGRYRNKQAIKKNPDRYEALMEDSSKAGQILWDFFHGFGNVAVEKNKAYMDRFGIPSFADKNFPKSPDDQSPFGFASNLAYSSNGFYNHQHKDDGDDSELPLAFAMVIPTSKKTGQFAPKGYNVQNGQFIFRDIQVALNFNPQTVCLIIFRAQEYVHGTLKPSESKHFTKLGLSLQVATKASNACKKYQNGEYEERDDVYFGGVHQHLDKLIK